MQNQGHDAAWSSLDKAGEEEQGLDIWGFLQRRKSFVILLAMVGAGIGYLYFQRQTPRYSSAALLQVIHHNSDKRVETLMAERNLSDANFVVTSRKLLEPCYQKNNLGELDSFRGMTPENAIRKIAGMVSAQSRAANILSLSCEGPNPTETAQIANAVAQEFVAHQKESYEDAVTRLQQLLTRAKDELNESLKDLEDEYENFDEGSPLNSDGQNPHRAQLQGVESKANAIVIQMTEMNAELLALQEALDKGTPRDALLLLIGKQSKGKVGDTSENAEEAVNSARNMFQTLMPLLMEEALLSEELGAGHPKLVALRKRIDLTQSFYDRLAGLTPNKERSTQPDAPRDFLAIYMNSIRQEMAILAKQREELLALANREETAAKKLRAYEHQRANFLRRIARENSLLEDVQQQIRATELPTNMGGVSASILTEARHGGLVYPKLSQFLGLGAFLGGFLVP